MTLEITATRRSFPGSAWVLIGRSMRHILRTPDALILSVVLPVAILLMFVYVFGGAIATGSEYVNYVVPGIILLTAGFGSALTATSVTADLTEGFIDRLRSMPVPSSAAVAGHVVASMARNLLVTAVVFGVAMAIGFRPVANLWQWLGVIGVIAFFVLAITWISVILGLLAKTVDAANGFAFFLVFLPYVSSAFVPTDTLPPFLRAIAENQPVTPIVETARGLLLGTPIGGHAVRALLWCAALLIIAVPVSAYLFRRRTAA